MDFYFNGKRLSDFGYIQCYIDSAPSVETSLVSQTNFNSFKSSRGDLWRKTNITYDSPLAKSIQICKNPCDGESEISEEEVRIMQRWLCKNDYYAFRFISESETDDNEIIWHKAKIDMSKITIGEKCIGLQLDITTNAPYGYVVRSYDFTVSAGEEIVIDYQPDNSGYVFCDYTIDILEDGNLKIVNKNIRNYHINTTLINNCKAGNSILIASKIQQISPLSHSDDFNYIFPRLYASDSDISNSGNLGIASNKITFSLACKVHISYEESRKVGM